MPTVFWITNISWTRVTLNLDVALECDRTSGTSLAEFTLVGDGHEFPIASRCVADNVYRLNLNVTNCRDRRPVPDGAWRIVGHTEAAAGREALCGSRVLRALDTSDRVFLYDQHRASYIVSFGVSDDSEPAIFTMFTYQMSRRANGPPGTGRSGYRRSRARSIFEHHVRRPVANWYYRIARAVTPPSGNTILFASDARSDIEGNLVRIRDRMVERGLDERFVFQYSLRPPHGNSKWSTLRVIGRLASADIVLLDDYFALLEFLDLSVDTKVIQTWHAGGGFKAFGLGRFGKRDSPMLYNAHRRYTYAIVASAQLIPVWAEAFGIEETAVIPTGLPRIDTFLDPAQARLSIEAFRARNPELDGKRLILFAPTFRGQGTRTAHYDFARLDLAKLYDVCGDDTVILFHLHHFVSARIEIPPELSDRLYDVSDYSDTHGLLHCADVLITDYSSIVYEYSLLDRPMLFFAYDADVYQAARGFHHSFEDTAPGKICRTVDDLVTAIRNDDYETWKIERFRRDNVDVLDGGAADRVIDELILSDPRARPASKGRGTRG